VSGTAEHIVIIGGGHGGGSAAAFLRQFGWTGPITLISDEPIPPYHRPPLSKAWLKGEADAKSLALRPAAFYTDQNVTLRLSTRATAIDRAAKTVQLEGGGSVAYDHLILALGSRARKLDIPGADLSSILALRSAADADQLKASLGPGKRLAIIGGGYIGLEAAASGRALGAEVTIIERESRVLARVACKPLSDFFEAYHHKHGVVLELEAGVAGFEGKDGRVSGVKLSDGRVIACDAALVGVGGLANEELARDAGIECLVGIVVDEQARTSDPAVHAIGDCTHRPMPLYHRNLRLESVPNALEQAKQAAADLCGRTPPAPEVPWFWSDQYDIKLQIAGLAHDVAEVIVRGNPDEARFAVFHLTAEGVVQAVEAVNSAPEFMAGKSLIAKRKPIDRDKLRDPAVSMKEIAA
jgi:3-phenylpropionate/trans-cinnamate dioxygenase ferredoxin reductase component